MALVEALEALLVSGGEHRRQLDELLDRVKHTCRLGDPIPAVSHDVAELGVDLVIELGRCVVELEQLEVPS